MSREKPEEIADRQRNAKTVAEYSGNEVRTRSNFEGKWLEVTTIVDKRWKVTRYCFNESDLSTNVESFVVDKISKNSFQISPQQTGCVYAIYKGDKKKDIDWWVKIVYAYAPVKIKEQF